MKIDKNIYTIFKKGSKTYFYSTIFFPKAVKKDVFTLYSFLRKADDYVDAIPQDKERFYEFWDKYKDSKSGSITGDIIIDSFVELENRKEFPNRWVEAFLSSMEMDIYKSTYDDMDELMTYLFGSSEVVGLFMAKIMNLEEESFSAARHLGRAMQYINFIRDISEDIDLGRIYFPQSDLEEFQLENLNYNITRKKPDKFNSFIHKQLEVYHSWQIKAEKGFSFIPYRYLIPIKTASDMYKWTASQIKKDPFAVYKTKVKPSPPKIVFNVFTNSLGIPFRN
ncbi:phytoene/squalene synthase family protein [Methanobacterium alcaliphilum]|uniref:phytoene/squalene synthase family protein n=1 Tax=Methanobacterium alcaliphilum TaxID=392018 RepID=UPI00200ACE9A|nr:phytoene/squalene synthase family protein [Methanobacterium alcaliphilum]MCK9150642.1 phytoene/squalene synthase family protein [Methanobacterium alcaliphilum]